MQREQQSCCSRSLPPLSLGQPLKHSLPGGEYVAAGRTPLALLSCEPCALAEGSPPTPTTPQPKLSTETRTRGERGALKRVTAPLQYHTAYQKINRVIT